MYRVDTSKLWLRRAVVFAALEKRVQQMVLFGSVTELHHSLFRTRCLNTPIHEHSSGFLFLVVRSLCIQRYRSTFEVSYMVFSGLFT